MHATALTPQPNLNRFLGWSLALHVVVMVGLSVTLSHTIKVSPVQAIQVKLVGVPQPKVASKPVETPEEIRTQDSAAPKEPPPDMKNIPPSEAKTKMIMDEKVLEKQDKPNPIEAQKRPPVLDKNPDEKKVVKNKLDAKVVKNPEDFMKALDFVDKLAKTPAKPTPNAKATDDKAGEGPQLQLNMSENGAVDAIRQAVENNWTIPPGLDTRTLAVTVLVSVDEQGNLTQLRVTRGSGQPYFDNSLVRAIRKTVPLPIPHDKYDMFKDMELTFEAPQ